MFAKMCYSLFMESKKLLIGIIIFIILAGFSGWFIYRDFVQHRVFDNPTEDSPPSVENQANGGQSSVISGSKNDEEIKKQMPDLDREIIIKENLSTEVKLRAIADLKDTISRLKEDYDRREDWLNLGLVRKLFGDYEGAKEAWEFATIIRPNDPVAYHNLGELFWLHIPNYPLAEKYFLKAIEIGPENSLFYLKLHELYRYSYKEKVNLADDILIQGIKATGDPGLKAALEEFQKAH